jgi:hypothetical protein
MFKIYGFSIIGDSPLLMHNPRSMVRNSAGTTKRKVIPSPEEEAEIGTYRDEDGFLVFPAIGFRGAFYKAMSGYKVGKKSLRSVLGHTRVKDEWVYLVDPESKKRLKDYAIDTRRAVVQRQGIMRSRPRIEQWGTELEFLMNEEIATMPEDQLLLQATAILNEAGQTVGVGDFRLDRGGWFGMFHVEKSEIK